MRQGEHQAAQKSMSTIFPLREVRAIFSPSGDSNTSSGARSPMLIPAFTSSCSRFLAFVLSRHPFPADEQEKRSIDAIIVIIRLFIGLGLGF